MCKAFDMLGAEGVSCCVYVFLFYFRHVLCGYYPHALPITCHPRKKSYEVSRVSHALPVLH